MLPILSPVQDSSHTAETRRVARKLAADLGFEECAAERVAIVATEMCTNLLKHGGGGSVLLGSGVSDGMDYVELLGIDQGTGIAEISASARDGYSSTGTMGTGLGAIQRLSSFSDIYSEPGKGTAILARVAADESAVLKETDTAAIAVPKPGEEACGDAWGTKFDKGYQTVVLADGLGHGPEAATAARAAIDALFRYESRGPADLIEGIHRALLPTRGAAVAVAQLDRERHQILFSGLGNIAARICVPGMPATNLISKHGTAGGGLGRFREFTYAWPEGSALILHSDGLTTRWDAAGYTGLLRRDPMIVCGVLFRDCRRGSDDASIVAIK